MNNPEQGSRQGRRQEAAAGGRQQAAGSRQQAAGSRASRHRFRTVAQQSK